MLPGNIYADKKTTGSVKLRRREADQNESAVNTSGQINSDKKKQASLRHYSGEVRK